MEIAVVSVIVVVFILFWLRKRGIDSYKHSIVKVGLIALKNPEEFFGQYKDEFLEYQKDFDSLDDALSVGGYFQACVLIDKRFKFFFSQNEKLSNGSIEYICQNKKLQEMMLGLSMDILMNIREVDGKLVNTYKK